MWIVQKNIWKEPSYDNLLNTLNKYSIDHKVVSIVPFSTEIVEPIEDKKVLFYMGSIRLDEIAKLRGWITYSNDNFDYTIWSKKYKGFILNEGEILPLKDIRFPLQYDVFIRPILDNKSFTGKVLSAGDDLSKIQFTGNKSSVNVLLSTVKTIYSEYRGYFVDKQLISCSLYKRGSVVVYEEVFDEDLLSFYKKVTSIWTPSDNFVMDLARTPEGIKIIEIGSIHNCGLYDVDLSKLVQSIDKYLIKNTNPTYN